MTAESMQQLAKRALKTVEADEAHHLQLGWRQAVWAEFGPRSTAETRLTTAHRQRIALAVAAVEHVSPIWERQFADNDLFASALAAIKSVAAERLPPAQARKAFDELWNRCVHLASEEPHPEIAAGFAAVQALSTAVYDEFFDISALDPEREDGDDPEDFDSAFYTAAAQAGGLPWDEESSAQQRLAFWRWWLDEAVRIAHG